VDCSEGWRGRLREKERREEKVERQTRSVSRNRLSFPFFFDSDKSPRAGSVSPDPKKNILTHIRIPTFKTSILLHEPLLLQNEIIIGSKFIQFFSGLRDSFTSPS